MNSYKFKARERATGDVVKVKAYHNYHNDSKWAYQVVGKIFIFTEEYFFKEYEKINYKK